MITKQALFTSFRKRAFRSTWIPARPQYSPIKYAAFVSGGVVGAYLLAMVAATERERKPKRIIFKKSDLESNPVISWIKSRKESEKTVYSIVAVNALIFLMWRVPRAEAFMTKFFTHGIRSHPVSMLFSNYSHRSLWHLSANMLALTSFGTFLHDRMGREQFLAFYTSCGLLSSGLSHLVKSIRYDYSKSLGASGAIFGIASGCAHYPDLKVSIIFLPFVSAPIGFALPAFMLYDFVGLINRWTTFDHAAHLGGAVSGYILYAASRNHIWPKRREILTKLGYFKVFPK